MPIKPGTVKPGQSISSDNNWREITGSSFYRSARLKLHNEDPRSDALFDVNGRGISGISFYRSGRLKLQNEDRPSIALFDVNWHKINGFTAHAWLGLHGV